MKYIKAGPILLLSCLAALITSNAVHSAPMYKPGLIPEGWVSAPTIASFPSESNFDVSSGKELVYSSIFNAASWTGDIRIHSIGEDGVIRGDATPAGWTSPAKQLDNQSPASRNIATFANGHGIPFRADSLPRKLKNMLGSNDTEAAKLLRYVRGDRTQEGPQGFRVRHSVLGPIIHSNIHYWSHSSTPKKPRMIYVGSNSGMLHAFNARTGKEEFAYIPSMVIENLRLFATRQARNTAFVDGQISIARVQTGNGEKTILVGTLGAGGKGLYALDITNPMASNDAQVANKVLWEATQSDSYPNMGHIYGRAQIARLKNGRLVAITGNGYASRVNSRSVLYIIDLLTGEKLNQIVVPNKSENGSAGLSTPTLMDTTSNSYPDLAYAGDIDGVLWKFDLAKYEASKLFETPDERPITTAPLVAYSGESDRPFQLKLTGHSSSN